MTDPGPGGPPPSVILASTVLGGPSAQQLGHFYRDLLGWDVVDDEPDWVKLRAPGGRAGGQALSFQTEPDHLPPVWPAEPGRQQMMLHLDFLVQDLAAAGAHAVACGARLAEHQFEDGVQVYLDPAGHPFCLFLPGS